MAQATFVILYPVMFKNTSIFFVFSLGMLCAFAPMCTDVYLPALPQVVDTFNTTTSLAQSSLTASFLGLALGQLIIGPVSDTYGRTKPLIISLVLFAISSFFCAIAPTITLFILFRVLQGMCASGGIVLTRSIACDLYKGHELTSFMAFLMSINSLAPILAPLLGSLILSFVSWVYIFYILCAWVILMLIMAKAFVKESLPNDKRDKSVKASLQRMKTDIFNLKFMLVVLSLSFIMAGFFSYLAASPFVFQRIYEFSAFEFSLTFAFISICVTVVAPFAGRLSRRLSELKVVIISIVLMIISGAVVIAISFIKPQSFIYVLAALAVYCSMMGLSQTAGFSVVMSFKRGGAGAASGIFGVMYFAIGSLISPLVGILGEKSMLPLGLNLFICAIIALLFLFIALKINVKAEQNTPIKEESVECQ